jgi:hypothetical protein
MLSSPCALPCPISTMFISLQLSADSKVQLLTHQLPKSHPARACKAVAYACPKSNPQQIPRVCKQVPSGHYQGYEHGGDRAGKCTGATQHPCVCCFSHIMTKQTIEGRLDCLDRSLNRLYTALSSNRTLWQTRSAFLSCFLNCCLLTGNGTNPIASHLGTPLRLQHTVLWARPAVHVRDLSMMVWQLLLA